MKIYNLFISHSWSSTNAYTNLVKLLNKRRYFSFKDYSVPKNDPINDANKDAQLRKAIRDQMIPCHVVLVTAGVYSTYSKWINIEIDIAKNGFRTSKPILAIKPWGNTNVSSVVNKSADMLVNWNTESIVAAIRKLG